MTLGQRDWLSMTMRCTVCSFCLADFPTRYVLQDPRKVSGILDEGCVKETGLPVKETKLHMDVSAFSESNFVFVMT